MLSTIIFLSIFIIILSVMLSISLDIRVDFNNANLKIKIYIYKIMVLTISIDMILLKYRINNGKEKNINIFIGFEQKYLIKQIKTSIIDKLYYDSIDFKSNISCNDSKSSIDLLILLNIICWTLKECLSYKNKDIKIKFINTTDCLEKENFINLKIGVMFTIFDMVFALIISFVKRGKYVKQKKLSIKNR